MKRKLGNPMLWLAFALVAASPATEVRAALSDLQTVPATDRHHIRYLSSYHLKDSAKVGRAISFAVNSVSNARRLIPVKQVNDTLWRLDIRHYQWAREAWEKLTKTEPYFRLPWAGDVEVLELWRQTNSTSAIFRADWFLDKISVEPGYSEFLGLPPKLADVKAKYRVDEQGARDLSLPQGGSVVRSIVTINNRRLERIPTLTGYWWQSYDFVSSNGPANVIENLLEVKPDAGEFIWSLPNGLQGYYLANAAGVQQAEAPANIAQDSQTPFRLKSVVNARSCVGCHAGGINQFSDVVSNLLDTGHLDIKSYDYKRAEAVGDFYRGQQVRLQIDADSAAYQAAVLALCGAPAEQVANEYIGVLYGYREVPVTISAAAVEVGCTVDELTAAIGRTYAGTLLAMATGQSVPRDTWEASFAVAAVAVKGVK